MDTNGLLEKAEQFIRSAKVLTDIGDFDSATSRLYYAMFFVAEALLNQLGLAYSSHQAVMSAYGQYFAKTQQLDPRFHRILLDAFAKRQLGDYAIYSGLDQVDVENLLPDAIEFLAAARQWLTNHPQTLV